MSEQQEKDRIKFEKYYLTIKGRAAHMLQNARTRAKKKGLNITITQDWIIDHLKPGICSVTGLPFHLNINGGKGHIDNPFSPSIDRIDQKGDYTPENCRITVWIYNRSRGAFSDADFAIFVDSLLKIKQENS